MDIIKSMNFKSGKATNNVYCLDYENTIDYWITYNE